MLFKNSKKREKKSKMEHLVKQYGTSAFMYTQYPHKRFWEVKKSDEKYKETLASLGGSENGIPSVLYLHIPYCKQLCYFCTCHMAITSEYSKVKDYMNLLFKEIDAFSSFVTDNNIKLNIKEIHLGGGSPTFIDVPEFETLCNKLSKLVNLKELDTKVRLFIYIR